MKQERLSPLALINLESGAAYIFQAQFFPKSIQNRLFGQS